MNSRERRLRRARRLRRRRAITLVSLLLALVLIIALRVGGDSPERDTEAAEPPEITPTVIAVEVEKLPERLPLPEETEEPEEIEPSRYDALEISESDIYTLACLVYHEARGESFEGQVAVIEVVFNRMLSPYFPDTVEAVVFQKYGDVWQFSPAPYLWTAEPGEMQFDAVHTALTSTEYILTADTVYFSGAPYNEHISAIIGGHYFCEID